MANVTDPNQSVPFRVQTRQRKCQGNFNFFKVREFYGLSGQNEILSKCQGFYISVMRKLRFLVLMYLSCLIDEIFDSDIVREI